MTYAEANTVMFGMFWPAFKAECVRVLGYEPMVYWPDKKEGTVAPTDKLWLRVSRQTTNRKLRGMGNSLNQSRQLYVTPGILFIQLFYPQSDTNSSMTFGPLAEFLSNLLLEKASADNLLWTRDSYIVELSSESSWFRKNVVTTFEYQDVKR